MLQKANQAIGSGGIYIPPKNSYETKFGIQHFAGIVHYDSKGIIFFLTAILRGGGKSTVFFLLCSVWSVLF